MENLTIEDSRKALMECEREIYQALTKLINTTGLRFEGITASESETDTGQEIYNIKVKISL